jgi:ATP-dependent RNA helicase DeaD
MNDFEDLKLDPGFTEHLRGIGYRRPTALQVEAIPVIARGTTAAGVASAGSGLTLAYAAGLAARLDAGTPTTQALVLRPTDDGAAVTADALHRLMRPSGLSVAAVRPRAQTSAHVAVASPNAALSALEHSAIKMDGLDALVVDGASAMVELGSAEALETLTSQTPKDAQRILFTSCLTEEVKDWLDRHARRARSLTYIPAEVAPLDDITVQCCVAPRHEWLPTLVGLLAGGGSWGDSPVHVWCGLQKEVTELVDRLAVRGFQVDDGEENRGLRLLAFGDEGAQPAAVSISWGVPPDLETLRDRTADSVQSIIFAEPRRLPHLQSIAQPLAVKLTALKLALPPEAPRSAQVTRDQLREAASDRDLEPYMLLLEPLLDEFTPVQLAAAATALLRKRAPVAAAEPLPAWTRLYFGVGRRDNVRPADLVGAITGEAPVSGDQIGRIDIRDNHTMVEIAAPVADQVIKALGSATIRGRAANVRVFRD